MDKLVIEVNNGKSIELSFHNLGLLVERTTENGTQIKEVISQGDLVSLLNWYNYQKLNGNKDLMF